MFVLDPAGKPARPWLTVVVDDQSRATAGYMVFLGAPSSLNTLLALRQDAGKAFLDMLGVFAEFETNLRRERQMEGIAAAKVRGIYKGRPATIDPTDVRRLHREEKLGPAAIARRLGMARSSVYRVTPELARVAERTQLSPDPRDDDLGAGPA